MSVEPEVEYRPEGEFTREVELPAETCEGGSGTARPTTDTASPYTTADKPEVAASCMSLEVTTSSSITPQIPRTFSIPRNIITYIQNLMSNCMTAYSTYRVHGSVSAGIQLYSPLPDQSIPTHVRRLITPSWSPDLYPRNGW